jgi:hypothetical protein
MPEKLSDERSHKVESGMFPTDAAVRLEGLHPQITMRRMTTNMLRHLGAILVRAFRPVIAFAVSTACIVFCTVMRPFKTRHRQVALPCIAPDEMNPCAKMSRQLERREFFDLWHGSYPCCIRLRNELGTDLSATSLPSLDSNARIAGASLTDMSPGKGEATACVDIANLQEFYFPEVTIIAYAYALCSAMTNTYRPQGFTMPIPPDTLVAVLGIIRGVLLPNKKTQHG